MFRTKPNEGTPSSQTPNVKPTESPKPEAPAPEPIGRSMPQSREYEENPVKGCLLLFLSFVMFALGVWKLVELIIALIHWI
jgi:hypothetical protein